MRDRRGFTLIEMLLVVIIIGILAGLAIPGVSGLVKQQNLRAEARQMVSVLRELQDEALTTESAATITFPTNKNYVALGKNHIMPEGITYTVSPTTTQISFDPLGSPTPSGLTTIKFSDGEGHQMQVQIQTSGRIIIVGS